MNTWKVNKTKKRISKILNLVILILVLTLGYKIWSFLNKPLDVGGHNFVNTPSAQQEVQAKVDKDKVIKQSLTKEFKKTGQLIVLEGKITLKRTYSTDDRDLNEKAKNGGMKWFVNKIKDLKVKEIEVYATYRYEYVFDFNLIEPYIKNGIVSIALSEGQLHINPLAEITSKTLLSDHTRLLSGHFSPQEITAYMNRTLIYATNYINSENKLKHAALQSAVENIKDIGSKFGVPRDDIYVDVCEDELVTSDQVELVE